MDKFDEAYKLLELRANIVMGHWDLVPRQLLLDHLDEYLAMYGEARLKRVEAAKSSKRNRQLKETRGKPKSCLKRSKCVKEEDLVWTLDEEESDELEGKSFDELPVNSK